MVQWLMGDIPWGIGGTEGENVDPLVWLDEATIAPLEGREFIHGVWDCYSCVRDWYRLKKGLTIPNFPRGMEWWEKGANHYEDNYGKAGFTEVDRADTDVGDVCLMQFRSPVPNHAAVITGPNEILHHVFHRYSGSDRFDRWERVIVKFLRYTGTDHA
jgi:cell wall-associated NlpC family hydrolase